MADVRSLPPAHVLFANTGVQIVAVPLRAGVRYASAQIGYGWQRCLVAPSGPKSNVPKAIPFVQWQIIQSQTARLFLAIDTTCGNPEEGYFGDAGTLVKDFTLRLENILDLAGQPLRGVPAVEVCIRPAAATAGDAKGVHLVVDFGNSRTGALLVELSGEVAQQPLMLPLELVNRYHLDAWNEQGEFQARPSARWFSSKTHWCNTPYLRPLPQKRVEYRVIEEEPRAGWFGRGKGGPKQVKVEVVAAPPLFDDLSMVRMGREADDVLQVMRAEGDIRTGVSSPKRYLWADDASWLEGANWFMADPADRCQTGAYAATLQGPYLRFLHEDDRDFLLAEEPPQEGDFASEKPLKPRHAPRALMTAALYELLCQAYAYVNSAAYRNASGDASRPREIRTLTLTYPSGMILEEFKRLEAQARKAVAIFAATLGKSQRVRPELNLGIDEASAVHLTYIWSELLMLGQDPRLWFAAMRRERARPKAASDDAPPPAAPAAPAAPRRLGPSARRPGAANRLAERDEAFGDSADEIRIACIDIGGGTSDLMIARYRFEAKIDDYVRGEVLHQDGISLAGDQLVKRLLEVIVVPQFARALGLEEEDAIFLFGPEVPRNRAYRAQRLHWMNGLFVPLAQAYLNNAVDEVRDEPITHTDPEIVDPVVLESLQRVFDKVKGPGYYNAAQELDLYFNAEVFEAVVRDVFDELLFDYCQRMVQHEVDVVLLAGLPSKLQLIQQLVRTYLPLAPSRIVPMDRHYAGNWYPYQDESGHNPGVIVDPKSPVVVGAAIHFLARNGMLPQFKFSMKSRQRENSYYWGVMSSATSGIRRERILFEPSDPHAKEEITEFSTSSQRVIIGRKMSPNEEAQASPVYLLKMDAKDRIGETQVAVRIKRRRASPDQEESLEVIAVTGTVAGEEAVLGENVHFVWRTLADERYYLDTGGLDNIEWSFASLAGR